MRTQIYRRSREVFASEWVGPGGTPAQADAYAEAVIAESAARGVPVAIRLFDGRRGVPEGQALPIWSDPSFRDAVMQYLMA